MKLVSLVPPGSPGPPLHVGGGGAVHGDAGGAALAGGELPGPGQSSQHRRSLPAQLPPEFHQAAPLSPHWTGLTLCIFDK